MQATSQQTENREWVTIESDGKKLFGVIHMPKEAKGAMPIVVFLHGYASHKVGTNRSSVRMAEALSQKGIASLRFDFRGCGDSEGDFSEMTFNSLIQDALAVFKWIESNSKLDDKRMGVLGSSLGGSVAVMAAKQSPSVKALALWAPVASGQHWFMDFVVRNPGMSKEEAMGALKTYQGVNVSPIFQMEFGQMNAAETAAKLDNVPLLHIHGENDSSISLEHQKAFQKGCGGASAPTEFVTIPGADHILGLSTAFPKIVASCLGWFEKHL